MFAVMGVTGNVGGEVAAGAGVRAVVREERKGEEWKQRGCEIAVADIHDAESLKRAFAGAEGVFVLVPPVFDPQPGFPEAHSVAASVRAAIEAAQPGKVVYLSTVGAQAKRENLLTQHTIIEEALRDVTTPIAFLRPGWFMENAAWDVGPASETGVIPSFLFPLAKPVAMVATADIGRVAAELLRETWAGHRVVELEGPKRTTPNEIAETFGRLLGKPVRMQVVPRASWEQLFRSQGVKNPEPRIRMLDGFNEGWIDFEGGVVGTRKGVVTLEAVLTKLVGGEKAG